MHQTKRGGAVQRNLGPQIGVCLQIRIVQLGLIDHAPATRPFTKGVAKMGDTDTRRAGRARLICGPVERLTPGRAGLRIVATLVVHARQGLGQFGRILKGLLLDRLRQCRLQVALQLDRAAPALQHEEHAQQRGTRHVGVVAAHDQAQQSRQGKRRATHDDALPSGSHFAAHVHRGSLLFSL